MDLRRTLLAFALSLGVLILWGRLFPPPETPPPTTSESRVVEERASEDDFEEPGAPSPDPVRSEVPDSDDDVTETTQPAEPEIVDGAEDMFEVRTEDFEAVFTNRGAQLVSFRLFGHSRAAGGNVDLVRSRDSGGYPFALLGPDGESLPLNDALFVGSELSGRGSTTLSFQYRGPAGRASKRFTFREDGLMEVSIEADGRWRLLLGPGLRNPTAAETSGRFLGRQAVFRAGGEVERLLTEKIEERTVVPAAGLDWVGIEDAYFLTAAVPREGLDEVVIQPVVTDPLAEGEIFRPFSGEDELTAAEEESGLREVQLELEPKDGSIDALAYFGAKELRRLESYPFGLDDTVDLGFFGLIGRPMLKGLFWIHDNLVANYGWAIILLTVLLRIVLFPLNQKSFASMQKMQELNPKVQAIRAKYRPKLKNKQGRPNPEAQRKMNEEVMALYKTEGVNPAGGCLPMLLQLPVLLAFYRLLPAAVELRNAPWLGWVQDLSSPDPYYILPIVMGVSMLLQQRMTPSSADPMQRRMFMLMPILFTFLFLGFPSGMVLYWLTNNVLGIAQQWGFKKWKERRESAAAA